MHLVIIGGSDAGISAALRARELDPAAEVTVVVADAYPNFSICGIPYYVSGEVTHWRNLAHRTIADLEATGMRLRLDTTARRIDVAGRKLLVTAAAAPRNCSATTSFVGTGAVPVRPPIGGLAGPGALGPGDGVHLLHSMGDTFALMRTLEQPRPASAVIVGAGYIGLEMADALTTRGLAVTQMEQLPEVLPTVDPELGALVHAELAAHGVEVLTGTTVQAISQAPPGASRAAARRGHRRRRHGRDPRGRHGAGRRRGAARHRPGRRRRGRPRRQGRDRRRPAACAPACPTSSPPGTASSPTTGCSARPTCRWAPPPTSRAGSPGRTPSAGTGEFAGSLGTQVVKIFDQAAARTGLRDHEASRRRVRPGHRRVAGR